MSWDEIVRLSRIIVCMVVAFGGCILLAGAGYKLLALAWAAGSLTGIAIKELRG